VPYNNQNTMIARRFARLAISICLQISSHGMIMIVHKGWLRFAIWILVIITIRKITRRKERQAMCVCKFIIATEILNLS